eukprot:120129_1
MVYLWLIFMIMAINGRDDTGIIITKISDNAVSSTKVMISWTQPIKLTKWDRVKNRLYFDLRLDLPVGYWYKLVWRRRPFGAWAKSNSTPYYHGNAGNITWQVIHSDFETLQGRIVGSKNDPRQSPQGVSPWVISSQVKSFAMIKYQYLSQSH